MMELDDLKNSWAELDDRLKKNETLEGRIIKEMLQNKSNKSLNKLINNDMLGVIVCILIIPFLIWVMTTRKQPDTVLNYVLFFVLIYVLVNIPWQIRKLILLMKMDFSKGINNNIQYANQYSICIKKDKLLSILGVLICAVIYVILGIVVSAGIWMWTLLISILIALSIFSYWYYKKIYKANIQSIVSCLEELKELEEE